MNLDNLDLFKQFDRQNLLAEIDALPEQLQAAWELGATLPLPNFSDVQNIVIAALGDSALAADLVSTAVSSELSLPLMIHRANSLPAFAKGKRTLVICLGTSEEIAEAMNSALKNDCSILVISHDENLAKEKNFPVWKFAAKSGFAYSFGLLLALFARLGWIADPATQVKEAVAAMKTSQEHLRAEVPAANNPAKRYAGQLVGRWVTVVGAGNLAPLARLWKAKINRMAKAAANCESMPEAGHNAAYGTLNPSEVLNSRTMTLFLRAPSDAPQDKMQLDMLRQHFMLEGMNTDVVDARGESILANLWTLVLFGNYMAYYLAMAYGVDPA